MSECGQAVHEAAATGVAVTVDGGKVVVADTVPEALAERLRAAGPVILATLHRWRDRLGRWTRSYGSDVGQRMAFGDMVVTWHLDHGRRGDPGHCAGCGKVISDDDAAAQLRDGARLHEAGPCAESYVKRWRKEAAAALAAIGIAKPDGWES